MLLKRGNIFDDYDVLDFVGITTNSILNKKGELVMGAGIAKTAKEFCPELPSLFGSQIKEKGVEGGFYGLLLVGKYLAFQTKRDWRDKSDIQDVIRSINMLKRGAEKYPNSNFGIPFPAINNGGLKVDDILPHINYLPDNVTVYHLEEI